MIKKHDATQIGRLALRREGLMWNAYLAKPNTMEGAVAIGSITMAAVLDNPKRKADFQRMMTEFVEEMIHGISGERPEMEVREAPPHERTPNAVPPQSSTSAYIDWSVRQHD